MRIAISGSTGFIGSHLIRWLSFEKGKYEIVIIEKDTFDNSILLDDICQSVDVIVHLAGKNRSADDNEIYNTNVMLSKKLVESLSRTKALPHIILSSSTQETRNNVYGNSKRDARNFIAEWASHHKAKFSGLIIPNVFGPFAKPFYNTVVSTFSHQLVEGQLPQIENDAQIQLIYVDELIHFILNVINQGITGDKLIIPFTSEIKVSELLKKLETFKDKYIIEGELPYLATKFELNLFNTFRSYISLDVAFPKQYKINQDNRGVFVELARLGTGGQVSFSTTLPGQTRGNHFHTRKIERFAVIFGIAKIELRKIGDERIFSYLINAEECPAYVDMPIWYTHNITNVGLDPLVTIFWINEPYNPLDGDTYMENVQQ